MSNSLRRYEILLPRRFNDGEPIPEEFFADTMLELRQQFGAVSCETQIIHGQWQQKGLVFRDDLIRFFVDVTDDLLNRQYFVDFKERAKARFRQIDIRLTTYLVEEV
jgi:hypothetical protein